MVWPWKRDDSSPASFEKALAKLSDQITQSTIRLDTTRTRARRVKALWTLYTSIAYLIYSLIVTLILGPKNWDITHYGGIVGAPIVIFGVRKITTMFYNWRASSEQAYLDDLQKQRDRTIDKLKAATKYNSTQELLNKYGGTSAKSTPLGKGQSSRAHQKTTTPSSAPRQKQAPGRTGIAPPPTANIPGRQKSPSQVPSTPARPASRDAPSSPSPVSVPYVPDEPGFAPNAFPPSQSFPQAPQFQSQSHWYDRLFDVLLGEDETLPKNRLVLICSECRLVNGQAPPGVKSLDDFGKWRCGGCGAWNGQESETRKVLQAMREKEERDRKEGWEAVSRGDEMKDVSETPSTLKEGAQKRNTRDVIPSSDGEDDEDDQNHSDEGSQLDESSERISANPSRRVTRSARNSEVSTEL
ncbi:hypothetical protein UCRPC4_g05040 [Phaeomoniella chlamydospora]|uniref:Endoplasmic reticulum junction formation protein lunapark n=1 Tax=Phaeomoniella chlamydospora TaxID=158046 RepID=A0A0G2E6S4_PHACM|nr:hypothetical protein UCRPC4_g05040 [Phaeomoniella chlamydospora]